MRAKNGTGTAPRRIVVRLTLPEDREVRRYAASAGVGAAALIRAIVHNALEEARAHDGTLVIELGRLEVHG